MEEAGKIYRHLVEVKGAGRFVPEISMDETELPQTPMELLIILAAIADEGIPIQTIAPKFTGRFNKGVDYVGDVRQFAKEFNEDIRGDCFCGGDVWIAGEPEAERALGLGQVLDLRCDSRGGDEVRSGCSSEDGGDDVAGGADRPRGGGRQRARDCQGGLREAYAHADELMKPYAAVIDIDRARLPLPGMVEGWTSDEYTSALRHDTGNPAYNQSLRQLLHVGFKVAAKMGDRYLRELEAHEV